MNEECGAAEIVAKVPWNPNQQDEFKLYSGDEDNQPASEKHEQHQETHTDRKNCCQICGKEFSTQRGLCQHTKNQHGVVKPHKCVYCRKRFAYRNPLIVHLRTHTKEKPFLGPVCGKNISLMGRVKSRVNVHRKKTAVMTSVQEEEEAVGGLINSDGEEVEWDPVNLGHKLYSGDKGHQTASEEQHQKPTPGKHCCKVCGKEFNTQSGLCQHREYHTGVKSHECIHCGKRFAYLKPLEIHLRTHTKEKPFPCPVCGKKFSRLGNARSHMKTHTKQSTGVTSEEDEEEEAVGGLINSDGEEVEWDLASCGKTIDVNWTGVQQQEESSATVPSYHNTIGKELNSQSSLPQNKKVHTKDKPHQCVRCGMRFQYHQNLKKHLRIHVEKKPYACPVYDRGYSHRCRMTAHQKTHSRASWEEREMTELEEREEQASQGAATDVNQTGDEQLQESTGLSCCQVCGKQFNNNRALHRHHKTHTGAKPHKCSQCGKGFNYLNRLKRHHLIHTEEKPFPCPVCGKRFSRKDRQKEHLNTHDGCSSEAKEIAEALDVEETVTSDGAHMGRDPEENSPDVELPGDKRITTPAKPEHSVKTTPRKRRKKGEAEELFSCADCNKEFQSIYARDRHMREKHGKHLLHKCCDCGQTFRANRSLIVHQRIYHPAAGVPLEPQDERRAPKTYLCSACGKEFPTSASLNRHLIIHSGRKPYKCTVCGRGFTQIGNLKTHQKVHKGGKPNNVAVIEKGSPTPEEAQSSVEICLCHLCWTQFPEKKKLEEHMKHVHESKKPHACTECGKRFTYIQKLKEHQAGHEGLKPYQCSQCNKGFHTPKGLENHMRDHTGEKPFPCSICGKRFKQASTLRAHYVTHSGERPHLCSICGKRYARTEELKVHLRVHTGEKPYQCDECGKSFYYRQGFNNHKKTHNAKPIGPTRQLGRPRQPGSPRKASKPKKISQRALPDSDGEDLTWDPPNLGNRPHHHLGNQENHAAADHSQISPWNFHGHCTAFNPWGQNPNTSYWRAADSLQPYYSTAGPSMSFSAMLRGTAEDEPLQESCLAERPSWPSGLPVVPAPLELGLDPPHPQNTTSQKTHFSKRGAETDHHDEQRPTTQDQDHSTSPTGEACSRTATVEESRTCEQPQEELSEEPKQFQGTHKAKKKYDCPTCGKVFSHNTALRRHLVIHSGKRPFKCSICGRGFTQSGNLKTHMKVHRGELPSVVAVQERSPSEEPPITTHVCGECGMDFPQKQQLEEHHNNHKKPYACPDCSKTFKNEYYFKIHKRIHSGDSPFLCSECGKSCVTADSLKKHELTHTGEKNFRCDQCGRAFIQSSHLNVHLKTHTGERPHLCSICGKSYSKACDLKVHLRVHTGEKPYNCEKCGKCFYYSQGYRAHLKTHDKKPKQPTKPLGRPKQQPVMAND